MDGRVAELKECEMANILELEDMLEKARKQQGALDKISPRMETGIVIDLKSPDGNVFFILGLCNRLAKQYHVSDWKTPNYTKLNYKEILDICQKQFGLIYING